MSPLPDEEDAMTAPEGTEWEGKRGTRVKFSPFKIFFLFFLVPSLFIELLRFSTRTSYVYQDRVHGLLSSRRSATQVFLWSRWNQ